MAGGGGFAHSPFLAQSSSSRPSPRTFFTTFIHKSHRFTIPCAYIAEHTDVASFTTSMDGPSTQLPEDAPPAYTEVPVTVDSKPQAPLATAPDGHPVLESDANVVAHTVELPPDEDLSADARLDLKDPDTRDIGWNKDMGHLPPTIVHGLSNEDLFLLIRRFNKVSARSSVSQCRNFQAMGVSLSRGTGTERGGSLWFDRARLHTTLRTHLAARLTRIGSFERMHVACRLHRAPLPTLRRA